MPSWLGCCRFSGNVFIVDFKRKLINVIVYCCSELLYGWSVCSIFRYLFCKYLGKENYLFSNSCVAVSVMCLSSWCRGLVYDL